MDIILVSLFLGFVDDAKPNDLKGLESMKKQLKEYTKKVCILLILFLIVLKYLNYLIVVIMQVLIRTVFLIKT